jgi:hypothetical protein
MLKESYEQTVPMAEIRSCNGVQNGVQNDRIGLNRIELDTVGLPMKSAFFTPEMGRNSSDSDPRLQVLLREQWLLGAGESPT